MSAADANDRYRRLVELSPDGILIAQDDRIVFANQAAERLFGAADAGQLLGASPLDLLVADRGAGLRDRLARLLAGESAAPMPQRVVRLDGAHADVEMSVAPLRHDGAVQIIVRDITERARTEAALRESEERLTLAFAGAQEGVWDWNLETNAVVYSHRWKEMLGYDGDEIEPHVSAWERLLHPDDTRRARELNEQLARGGDTYEGEFRLRHKDGHYVHVLSRGCPIRREPGGAVVRIVGTHFDLTERRRAEAELRESEERLRLAFEGAQEGVWDWNLETGAVVYSHRWKEMLGYRDDEIEPHVGAWERLLHPGDLERAREVHERVVHGAPTYEGEFRLRHKDGHYVHVLSRGYPVRREPEGRVVRIVGTHFDLTRRRQAEAERARTELLTRLLFAQEDERRRIAREMHDQFGEQLTALGLGIRALKASCDRPDLGAQIEALEAVAHQLDRDVDQLIWDLRPTALDDLGLRAALANHVQDWSRRVQIAARFHTAGLLDDRLAPEAETALYRIAQEALNNIAKHARAANVEIILERRADQVLLIVEDDGVGFDPDEAAAGRQGFGLLSMQERAALVGATLQIESTGGRGTTVLVRMPATRSNAVAAEHG